jgi:hypothetical protein
VPVGRLPPGIERPFRKRRKYIAAMDGGVPQL